jgi:hypothetical protein
MGVLSQLLAEVFGPILRVFRREAPLVVELPHDPRPRDAHRSWKDVVTEILPFRDPWDRLDGTAVLAAHFGAAERDFGRYFDGACAVRVESLEEMQVWLEGCEYATDIETFKRPDVWQHPSHFEDRRRGDCEDFALWAWRRLVELGYDAELVMGLDRRRGDGLGRRHVWIRFRREGGEYVYEPTERDRRARAHAPPRAARRQGLTATA